MMGSGAPRPKPARLFVCQCGNPVFFRNSLCLACNTHLGFDPISGQLNPIEQDETGGGWRLTSGTGSDPTLRFSRCGNFQSPAGCNWLIPIQPNGQAPYLCVSCRLNRTIPDLSIAGNAKKWAKIEQEKRQLVSSLLRLRLPVVSRVDEDPRAGVAFDFLSPAPDGPPVMTGHNDGIITLNINEAEDAERERVRAQLHEPYRSLIGHLRHEIGHYYWDRLVSGRKCQDRFRALFGDERQNYDDALARHYSYGPPAGWRDFFVSAYASSHPWEDWAESWAHYLHMRETLDTAEAFRVELGNSPISHAAFDRNVLCEPVEEEPHFLPLLNDWVRLTSALNELSHSMGVAPFYPFVLSRDAVAKLHFIHLLINRREWGWTLSGRFSQEPQALQA